MKAKLDAVWATYCEERAAAFGTGLQGIKVNTYEVWRDAVLEQYPDASIQWSNTDNIYATCIVNNIMVFLPPEEKTNETE